MTAANFLFSMYTAYGPIIADLAEIRKSAMDATIEMLLRTKRVSPTVMKLPQVQAAKREAVRVLKEHRIIGRFNNEDSYPVLRFTRMVEDAELRAVNDHITALEREAEGLKRAKSKDPRDRVRKDEIQAALKSLYTQQKNLSSNRGFESEQNRIYTLYQVHVIERLLLQLDRSKATQWTNYLRQENQVLKENETPPSRKKILDYIEAHYIGVQFSWFLLRGGRSAHLSLKKKLFLSVFGLITKSGYKAFETFQDAAGNLQIKDILRAAVSTPKQKRAYATFSNAPYVMFS
jgi:hypothetical protein